MKTKQFQPDFSQIISTTLALKQIRHVCMYICICIWVRNTRKKLQNLYCKTSRKSNKRFASFKFPKRKLPLHVKENKTN